MDELPRKSMGDFQAAEKLPLVIVLDNIRSMHNVGSIFRTADAFLVESIILCGYTPQPPHRDIQKTALGATETVKWEYSAAASEAVAGLRAAGIFVAAVEQVANSVPLHQFRVHRGQRTAIVFGNEVDGVSEAALGLCDAGIEIPQFGMKHSLNVSVAAGMVCWEIARQILV